MTAITNEMVSDMEALNAGLFCGLVYYHKHIAQDLKQAPNDRRDLQDYFKYHALGITRTGDMPKARYTKANRMNAEYQRATAQAANFRKLADAIGIDVDAALRGQWVTRGSAGSTLDMVTVYKGSRSVFNLIYTDLYANRWEPDGWHTSTLGQKPTFKNWVYHLRQVTSYDLYFWVFDAKSHINNKLLQVQEPNDQELSHYGSTLEATKKSISLFEATEWPLRPEYERCRGCKLKRYCDGPSIAPEPEPIVLI